MRGLLRRLALPLLRRHDAEIDRRLRVFHVDAEQERARVRRLGRAFLGGYNAMLEVQAIDEIPRRAAGVEAHDRPFFYEGAAMGYLPRGIFRSECTVARAEADLLGLDPAPLYLYYVGLGFWYGFRHRRRPVRLYDLTSHLAPLYAPLCWDGFGFKIGFFDFDPARPREMLALLERCPRAEHPWVHQGFGRALSFVFRDDPQGFEELVRGLPAERRGDLEFGHALGRGFTGVDHADSLLDYAEAAPDATRRARWLGVAWALAARRVSDPAYFESCLARASEATRRALGPLPDLCEEARGGAKSYGDWQERAAERLALARQTSP